MTNNGQRALSLTLIDLSGCWEGRKCLPRDQRNSSVTDLSVLASP
jgi:hypothetical protein